MPSLVKLSKAIISIPVLLEKQLIGKTVEGPTGRIPGILTIDHCRIVGHVANMFRRMLPSYHRHVLPRRIGSFCSLHDVGKACPGFLKRIYDILMARISSALNSLPIKMFSEWHATVSGAAFRLRFAEKENCEQYARIEECHHGIRDEEPTLPDTSDRYGGPAWSKIRQKMMNRLIAEFGEPYLPKLRDCDAEIVSGFLSICDWIASDERMFNQAYRPKDIHATTLKALKKLGWSKSRIRKGLSFKDIFGFDPRPEQVAFINSVTKPGVYVLEACTGSGKTEAALMVAYLLMLAGHHTGFYFSLPTRVTSNRIFKRVQKFLDNAFEKGMAPKLIHGQSLITDVSVGDSELAPGGAWFTANRRALMLPFGVGTIDQILLSAVNSRFNFVRTFGLANKVVILDEIHSYDVYTGKLSEELIKKLRDLGCTVIILSATLTKDRKQQILGEYTSSDERYPLITYRTDGRAYTRTAGTGKSRKVHIRKVRDNFPTLFKEAERRVLQGQQVLWVLNTVDRAVAVYEYMKNLPALSESPVKLEIGVLHSRIPPVDREPLENHWIDKLGENGDRSLGSLLISTQVMEQSVDVDADFLITDIAPSDFLIQRIGRLFRHERTNRACTEAKVWIVIPDLSRITSREELRRAFGVHAKIYSDYILWRTYRAWKNCGKVLTIPDDLREILEATYRDFVPQDPPWIQEAKLDLDGSNFAKICLAKASTGCLVNVKEEDDLIPVDILEEAEGNHATRLLSVPTTQLILTSKVTEHPGTVDFNFIDGVSFTLTKDKRYLDATRTLTFRLVKVPSNRILKEAVSPNWLEKVAFGNPIPVEVWDDTSVRLLDGTDTGYKYKRDCGIYKPKIL
jgi:CRISPR-associated endonuclease/helicase Cas3